VISEALPVARILIARWEGFRSQPYLCPAGVPTIGYGFTRYATGRRVRLTDEPMTPAAGRELLDHFILTEYMPGTLALCPRIDTPERLGALTDFAFNLGLNALKVSTLRRRVNDGDWAAVPEQLRRWVLAAGKKRAGLVARRESEILIIYPPESNE
jgi:lysozyme